MEGTTSYGGTCSACRIDLRSSRAMAWWPALCLTGVGPTQKLWAPSLPVLLPLHNDCPEACSYSREPPSPGPVLDSPVFASAWLFGKGNRRLMLAKGGKALGACIPFPRGDTGLLPALLTPPQPLPTPFTWENLPAPSPSDPPTQDRWAVGRLPRDGGGERRLPMSLRLEGFPDLLKGERKVSKRLCSTHY